MIMYFSRNKWLLQNNGLKRTLQWVFKYLYCINTITRYNIGWNWKDTLRPDPGLLCTYSVYRCRLVMIKPRKFFTIHLKQKMSKKTKGQWSTAFQISKLNTQHFFSFTCCATSCQERKSPPDKQWRSNIYCWDIRLKDMFRNWIAWLRAGGVNRKNDNRVDLLPDSSNFLG